MTALFGVVHHRGKPPSDRLLQRMHRSCLRRAPHQGVWRDGPLALGWSGSVQEEAWHLADDLAVMLCGWFEDPHDRPGDLGRPRTRDPAVLAERWRALGVDAAAQLDGEFCAAIIERSTGVVHLLRDPIGSRPLFWTRTPGRLAFATEIAPLLDVPWVERTLQRDHLAEYLSFRAVHAPRTLIRDVHAVCPGHRIRLDADGARSVPTHTPVYASPGTAKPPTQEVVSELTAAIERAVRRRLAGGADVGVYLSGGTGSTAIVAAAREAARTLRTWTVTVSDEPSSESPFAGRVAGLFGMEHHAVAVSTREIAEHFDEAVRAVGHPNGNVASVLQFLLARAVGPHVSEVLTGDGTDQLFGGRMLRQPATAIGQVEHLHRLPGPVRGALAQVLAPMGRGGRLRQSPDDVALAAGYGGVFVMDTAERRRLLVDDACVHSEVRQDTLGPFYREIRSDRLNHVLHAFFRSTLCTDTLPRVEATAAAAGLSAGFPLLDREVRRLAWLLPGSFKLDGLASADLPTRWLLRAVLPRQLPSALVNRPDRGLPQPLDGWLTGPGRLFFEERFDRLLEDPLGLWHATELEALRRRLTRVPGTSHRLWVLFILDSWIRTLRLT